MDLRILLLGVILGVLLISGTSFSQAVEGSGALNTADVDSESDDDIYMSGSGTEPTKKLKADDSNSRCLMTVCWCTYNDGTEVPQTRVFGKKPDCSRYGDKPTTTVAPLPTRSRQKVSTTPELIAETTVGAKNIVCNVFQCYCVYNDGTKVEGSESYLSKPDCSAYADSRVLQETTTSPLPLLEVSKPQVVTEVAEKMKMPDIDIEYVEPAKVNGKPDFVEMAPKTGDSTSEATTMNNKIPADKTQSPESEVDEHKEELTNMISNTGFLKSKEDVDKQAVNSSKPHPGILAALIGGGVVGLLCAILLILFLIYRIRKKDEGSYPLDDGKPLKNYAYSKAPSKEFYA